MLGIDLHHSKVLACLRITNGEWPEGFRARWDAWLAGGDERPEMMPNFRPWLDFCQREGLVQPLPHTDDEHELTDLGRFVLLTAGEAPPVRSDAPAEPVTQPGPASPYLTLAEAAVYCRRSPQTLSNHKSKGRLKALPDSRPPLFRREELDAWMNRRHRR